MSADSNTWLSYAPRMRPQIQVSDRVAQGPKYVYVLRDSRNDKMYRFGEREHFIASQFDGTTSLADVSRSHKDKYGKAIADEDWKVILASLYQRDLIEVEGQPAGPDTAAQKKEGPKNSFFRGEFTLFGDPRRIMATLNRQWGWFWSRWAVIVVSAAMLALAGVVVADGALLSEARQGLSNLWFFLIVVIAMWISTVFHELAHGVVATRHGGEVLGFGVKWNLPVVVPFCRVANYLFIETKAARVGTAIAGAYVNLVFVVPWAVVWLLAERGGGLAEFSALLVVVGTLVALVNVPPLPPLDGYTALEHALGVSKLADESRTFVLAWLTQRRATKATYPASLRRTYLWYFVGSIVLFLALATLIVLAAGALLPADWGALRWVLPLAVLIFILAGYQAQSSMRARTP